MSNIIDTIRVSGVTYTIAGSGSGNSVVELTQAQYDELVSGGTVDPTVLYIITDAQAGDLTQYWTSAQTQSAITEATSGKADTSAVTQSINEAVSGKADTSAVTASIEAAVSGKASQSDLETVSGQVDNKQDTLVSGTNIKTINNESLLGSGNIDIQGGGGGGKAISAGTNISVTTGATADTINCTLPISAGTNGGIIVGDNECSSTGLYSISIGHNADTRGFSSMCVGSNSDATGQMALSFGSSTYARSDYGVAFGRSITTTKINQFFAGGYLQPKNEYEVGFGYYSNTVSASTTFGNSGNTLFTIGNGYDFSSTHNWHNALEIRQNGDIYIADTNDTSVTGDKAYSLYPMIKLQDTITATAANTTALGGLSLVKLTQAEYDALATYDSNTLYVIVN